jgi:hypothetical protein
MVRLKMGVSCSRSPHQVQFRIIYNRPTLRNSCVWQTVPSSVNSESDWDSMTKSKHVDVNTERRQESREQRDTSIWPVTDEFMFTIRRGEWERNGFIKSSVFSGITTGVKTALVARMDTWGLTVLKPIMHHIIILFQFSRFNVPSRRRIGCKASLEPWRNSDKSVRSFICAYERTPEAAWRSLITFDIVWFLRKAE